MSGPTPIGRTNYAALAAIQLERRNLSRHVQHTPLDPPIEKDHKNSMESPTLFLKLFSVTFAVPSHLNHFKSKEQCAA
jgi:hypothetical protein